MLDQVGTALLTAEVPAAAAETINELGFASPPTNQQIIDAAKAAYNSYQPAVDAMTLALIATVKDSSLSAPISVLDGTNWMSSGIAPSITTPFFDSVPVQTALGVIRRTRLNAFSVGVFTTSMPGRLPGVIGFAGDVLSIDTDLGLIVELDIFKSAVSVGPGPNLQYGVWTNGAAALHDLVIGMYVNTMLQDVSINLKTLLTKSLEPYGFMASTGATVVVPTGVFAGSTRQWIP